MHLIFVYGTLKRGFCRSAFLEGQRFLATANTVPEYRLYDLGSYPGMVWVGQQGTSIAGELFEVDAECLAQLDEEEGVHEGLYIRQDIRLCEVGLEALAITSSVRQSLASRTAASYLFNGSTVGYPEIGCEWTKR
jgi:gamma-glutamylcyclotransferase (GGCT)/AIG2-like uncharacterized protein YtfP